MGLDKGTFGPYYGYMTADEFKGRKIRDNGIITTGGMSNVGTIVSTNLDKGTITVCWRAGSFATFTLEKLRRNSGQYSIIN